MQPHWVICGLLLCLLITYSTEDRRKYNVFGRKPYRSSYARTGISRSQLRYLFPSVAALGAIYIASRMRPRVHLGSYQDLYRHSVCEGRPVIYENGPEYSRPYSYFLCPSDPDKPFETYCCNDPTSGLGFCCSYDEKKRFYYSNRWGFVGGSIAALAIFTLLGATIYCLCCRNRRPSVPDLPVAETPPPIVGAMNVYPTNKPDFNPLAPPAYPYPAGPPSAVYPPGPPGSVYPPGPPPLPPQAQIGSGWNAPMNAWPGVPPPPYSANPSAPIPPT